MYVQHYTNSNTKNPRDPRNRHIPGQNTSTKKNNQMLPDKAPAEKLDDNNKERLQKNTSKFLYYAIAVDPTILMALNSLAVVHTKPTIEN